MNLNTCLASAYKADDKLDFIFKVEIFIHKFNQKYQFTDNYCITSISSIETVSQAIIQHTSPIDRRIASRCLRLPITNYWRIFHRTIFPVMYIERKRKTKSEVVIFNIVFFSSSLWYQILLISVANLKFEFQIFLFFSYVLMPLAVVINEILVAHWTARLIVLTEICVFLMKRKLWCVRYHSSNVLKW